QSLTPDGQPAESVQGLSVTADFFPALGVPPALGRWFIAEEDQPGRNQAAVLSDRFCRRRFGGTPSIAGQTQHLEAHNVTVLGVMPAGFEHPLLWGQVDVWRPIAFTPQQRQNRQGNFLAEFGRLKQGVTREQAEQAMVALAATLTGETGMNKDESLRLEALQ